MAISNNLQTASLYRMQNGLPVTGRPKVFYCAAGSSLWDTERMALWELMEMS